jgi:hypothetical protein
MFTKVGGHAPALLFMDSEEEVEMRDWAKDIII